MAVVTVRVLTSPLFIPSPLRGNSPVSPSFFGFIRKAFQAAAALSIVHRSRDPRRTPVIGRCLPALPFFRSFRPSPPSSLVSELFSASRLLLDTASGSPLSTPKRARPCRVSCIARLFLALCLSLGGNGLSSGLLFNLFPPFHALCSPALSAAHFSQHASGFTLSSGLADAAPAAA